MTHIYFGSHESVIGLTIVPLLVLFYIWVFRRKRTLLAKFGKIESINKLLRNVSYKSQYAKAFMLIAAVTLLVFTLMRPQYGAIQRPVIQRGVDIMIAIDTSNSMLAKDFHPNRLARAKQQLKDMIRRVKGDRIGIMPFAGEPFVACPLTLDKGLASDILESIDTKTIPMQGTNIADTIKMAVKAFSSSVDNSQKVLVLLTDGEDHEGKTVEAAQEAAKAGIMIFAIGIGSETGELIQLEDGKYLEDKEGHKVTSKMDFQLLQKIALTTGGGAVQANPRGDLELDKIFEKINTLDKATTQSRSYTLYEERFQWVLLPALLLLIFEIMKSDRVKVKKQPEGHYE